MAVIVGSWLAYCLATGLLELGSVGTGFCLSVTAFSDTLSPSNQTFYNHLLHVSHFSGSPTSALGPILQKSIAVTESNETHTLKIQTIA